MVIVLVVRYGHVVEVHGFKVTDLVQAIADSGKRFKNLKAGEHCRNFIFKTEPFRHAINRVFSLKAISVVIFIITAGVIRHFCVERPKTISPLEVGVFRCKQTAEPPN